MDIIGTIILGIPNFAVALWVIAQQERTIKRLIAANERLMQVVADACLDDIESVRKAAFGEGGSVEHFD